MSTVAMTLGGKKKIANVTATDTNGVVIPQSQLNITVAIADPTVVAESATTFGDGQIQGLKTGSSDVTWSAALTTAAGGGPAVPAATDNVVVARAGIATVTVAWTDSPV